MNLDESHLITVPGVAGYPVLRTAMAVEELGRREATSTQDGPGRRDNDGGGQEAEGGDDVSLPPEQPAVSQLLGLQVLLLRVPRSCQRDRYVNTEMRSQKEVQRIYLLHISLKPSCFLLLCSSLLTQPLVFTLLSLF